MAKFSTFELDSDNRINYADHTVINVSIKKNILKLLVFLCLLGLLVYWVLPDANTEASTIETISQPTVLLAPPYFSHDGFLFSDSSTVRLSTSEIRGLRDVAAANGESYRNLLRYAVNEIYARHGYRFEAGLKFDKFYSQFEWYRVLPKQSTVAWAEFNEVERYNLGLLLAEEEKNGYR